MQKLTTFATTTLQLVKKKHVPIEVNLTSNAYLEGSPLEMELLHILLGSGYTAVLATDNDGIWPTLHEGFHSVAGEFAQAIVGKYTKHGLSQQEVRDIVANYAISRFEFNKRD